MASFDAKLNTLNAKGKELFHVHLDCGCAGFVAPYLLRKLPPVEAFDITNACSRHSKFAANRNRNFLFAFRDEDTEVSVFEIAACKDNLLLLMRRTLSSSRNSAKLMALKYIRTTSTKMTRRMGMEKMAEAKIEKLTAENARLKEELEIERGEVHRLRLLICDKNEEIDILKSRQLGEFQVVVDAPPLENGLCARLCPLKYLGLCEWRRGERSGPGCPRWEGE